MFFNTHRNVAFALTSNRQSRGFGSELTNSCALTATSADVWRSTQWCTFSAFARAIIPSRQFIQM